ncbi:unnamed protein product [Gemmataceae bacterium]|nr:unnamed protein product [Gemmataceae bacterium]VTT97135.1 unnamed protein product [Gemmataceae bacterium]
MVRLRESLLLLAAAAAAASGCGFSKRPYGHDPLLRNGSGVWGNAEVARTPNLSPNTEPVAPHAPKLTHLATAGAKLEVAAQK